MEFIFHFLVALLWGYICYKMARKRGRDEQLAAILGALFGLFAVIGYWIAGYKNDNDITPPLSGAH